MRINIGHVVDYFGIERLRRGDSNDFGIVCPKCGNRDTACGVRIMKDGQEINTFNCFSCHLKGSMVDLYAFCKHGKEGPFSKEEGRSMFMEMISEVGNAPIRSDYVQQKPTEAKIKCKKAPMEVLDQVYRAFLSYLSLNNEDRDDLKRRGLTDQEIEDGQFRSMPKDTVGIARKLLYNGFSLEGIPGFYINPYGNWELFIKKGSSGYFCPAYREGRIVGMQIRLNHPAGGAKYIWLSSGKEYLDHGTSSGAPASFYGDPNSERVLIVEGTLKAYITYCLLDKKTSVLGVPGVSAIGDVPEMLEQHNHKIAIEGYDMDKRIYPYCDEQYEQQKCEECYRSGCYKNWDYIDPYDCPLCQKKADKIEHLGMSVENLRATIQDSNLQCLHWYWDSYWDQFLEQRVWKGQYKGIDDFLLERRLQKIANETSN